MFSAVWWTILVDQILSGYVNSGLIRELPVLFNRNLIQMEYARSTIVPFP